jgi:hypothetical protein
MTPTTRRIDAAFWSRPWTSALVGCRPLSHSFSRSGSEPPYARGLKYADRLFRRNRSHPNPSNPTIHAAAELGSGTLLGPPEIGVIAPSNGPALSNVTCAAKSVIDDVRSSPVILNSSSGSRKKYVLPALGLPRTPTQTHC